MSELVEQMVLQETHKHVSTASVLQHIRTDRSALRKKLRLQKLQAVIRRQRIPQHVLLSYEETALVAVALNYAEPEASRNLRETLSRVSGDSEIVLVEALRAVLTVRHPVVAFLALPLLLAKETAVRELAFSSILRGHHRCAGASLLSIMNADESLKFLFVEEVNSMTQSARSELLDSLEAVTARRPEFKPVIAQLDQLLITSRSERDDVAMPGFLIAAERLLDEFREAHHSDILLSDPGSRSEFDVQQVSDESADSDQAECPPQPQQGWSDGYVDKQAIPGDDVAGVISGSIHRASIARTTVPQWTAVTVALVGMSGCLILAIGFGVGYLTAGSSDEPRVDRVSELPEQLRVSVRTKNEDL